MATKPGVFTAQDSLSPVCPSPLSPSSPNIVDVFGPLPLEHSPRHNAQGAKPVSVRSLESMGESLLAEASTLRLTTPPRPHTAPVNLNRCGGEGNLTARDLVFEGFTSTTEAATDVDDSVEHKSSEGSYSIPRTGQTDESECLSFSGEFVTAVELLEEKRILIRAIRKCQSQRNELQRDLRAAERARDARHDMMLRLRDRVKEDKVVIEDLKAQKLELEEACAKKEIEYPDLRDEVEKLQQQKQSFASAVTLLEAENGDLKGVLLNCRSDLDEEQQTCSLLKKTNADLKMQLKVLEQEREDLIAREREITAENDRVQALTQEVARCQENIRKLKDREEKLLEECRKYEQQCAALSSKGAKIKELEAMIEEYESMRKNHAMSRLRLEGELKKENAKSNDLQAELMQLKQSMDQDQQRIEEDSYKLMQKLSHANQESRKLYEELESMQNRYSNVDVELGKLKLRLTDKTKELEEFKKKRMEDHKKLEQERLARKNQQRLAAKRISELEAHLTAEGEMVANLQKNLSTTKEELKGRDKVVHQLREASAQRLATENELRSHSQAFEVEKARLEEDVAIERVKCAHLETKKTELETQVHELENNMKAAKKDLRTKDKLIKRQNMEIEEARYFFEEVGQMISKKEEALQEKYMEVNEYKRVLEDVAHLLGSDCEITAAVANLMQSREVSAARARELERKGNVMGLELKRLQVKMDSQAEELNLLRTESAQLSTLRFRESHECRKQKMLVEDMKRLKAEYCDLQHRFKEEKQKNKFLKIINSEQNPPRD